MTPRETRAMRREQVERCLATTMTIKDWCALNGVPTSTMYRWMAVFRKEEPGLFGGQSASEWIEVTRESIAQRTALATRGETPAAMAPQAPTPEASVAGIPAAAIVVRLNGADVVVPDGADESHISSVLRAVASL